MLGAFGNVDGGFATQCGYIDFATQCGGAHVDGHMAVQVVAVSLEYVVLAQPDFNEQVARRAAVVPRLTVACAADAHAIVDTCRDFDFERFVLLELALSVASGAGFGDELAGTVAVRAGLLDTEKALAHLHRTRTVAG